jgi:hypothetical protein
MLISDRVMHHLSLFLLRNRSLNKVARHDDHVQMLFGLEQGLGHVFDRALVRWCGLHQHSRARGLLQLTKLRLKRMVVMEEFDNVVIVFDEIVKVVKRVVIRVRWFFVTSLLSFRRSKHVLDKQVQVV